MVLLIGDLRRGLLSMIPNLLPIWLTLGLMGWLGIPLDLMTITIAAITIGIAVDDSIHYVHRFTREFGKDNDYWAAVGRSHASIGRAMYYTSITVTLGFSILVLSNFVPTIYFGLLTGFAMLIALLANLTLLPLLIVRFKPLGPSDTSRPGDSYSLATPSAGSTRAAQNLNSGILPNGSSASLVSRLAAASW